jgi:hypothetical protein
MKALLPIRKPFKLGAETLAPIEKEAVQVSEFHPALEKGDVHHSKAKSPLSSAPRHWY